MSEAKPDEVEARFFHYFPVLDDFSGKSADLPGYCLFFLSFRNSAFFACAKKAPKKAREGGERKISPPYDPPLCAPEYSSFDDPPPRVDADLPALLMKCFELETWVLSPIKRADAHLRR